MEFSCCVENCKQKDYHGNAITFHEFPTNKKDRNKWIDVVPGNVTPSSVICSLHFKREDFSQNVSKRYLKRHAVPSIFPEAVVPKERKYLVVNQGKIKLDSLCETSDMNTEISISDVRTLRGDESMDKIEYVTHKPEENGFREVVNITSNYQEEFMPKTIPRKKHYITINQGKISLEPFSETSDPEPELNREIKSEITEQSIGTQDDNNSETLSCMSSDDEPLQTPIRNSVLTQTGPEIDMIKLEELRLIRLKKVLHQRLRRRNAKLKKLKSILKSFVQKGRKFNHEDEDSIIIVVS